MASEAEQKKAALGLSRFGFGARVGDLDRGDPIERLLSEIDPREPLMTDGALASSAEGLRKVAAYREQRRKAEQRRPRAKAAPGMEGPGMEAPSMEAPVMDGPAARSPAAEMRSGAMDAVPMNNDSRNTGPGGQARDKDNPPPQQAMFLAEAEARLARISADKAGFAERMVWFWSNHFCVSARNGPRGRVTVGPYEREAIRPHVFGHFADMLLAVAKHPAMLHYLDNAGSIGPNSVAGKRRSKGLNENYARETLELHTLGADGGYKQQDVTNLAKILTGWTITGPKAEHREAGTFFFNDRQHEPGGITLLGRRYADTGLRRGEVALMELARHPSTTRRKLSPVRTAISQRSAAPCSRRQKPGRRHGRKCAGRWSSWPPRRARSVSRRSCARHCGRSRRSASRSGSRRDQTASRMNQRPGRRRKA
jgi:uncharacterized protein (DUF1800 family)